MNENRVTIYHNPQCSKSRQTLALLQARDLELEVVEYLKDSPDVATLERVLRALGMDPHEIIREREHRALGLPPTDDASQLLERIAQHPQILQRPIVVSGERARIGRPPENVLEILGENAGP